MVYVARSGAGIGVAVGWSVGRMGDSVAEASVGEVVAVKVGSGRDVPSPDGDRHAAKIKDKRTAKKIVRRIALLYWLWCAS